MVSITKESTVGRRIVTAAEYDRWKAVNDEIHVDVKCSAEEVIVTLEGALPHTPFHLKDPGCRLEPISRNAQQIQVYQSNHRTGSATDLVGKSASRKGFG